MLVISHDIADSITFDRVLVVEEGRIVEDGNPSELASIPGSRLQVMLEAERAVREELWAAGEWRRLKLQNGALIEQ